MISYSNLGKVGHGNLGNSLWQIASCIGLSDTFNTSAGFPEWKYEKYFDNPLPRGAAFKPIKEQYFHYDTNQFTDNCDISGWLQSEKYFEHCKDKVKQQLKFQWQFDLNTSSYLSNVLVKETIAISIRRGDYVNNPNYCLLPISYYLGALITHFPNYKKCGIIIFSDDMDYCKIHFAALDNVTYAEGSDIEQLCLMSMCDHFIIANSTFSWWGSWLGEKPYSKVICPNYLFGYEYGLKNDAKDFYPERWTKYEHENKRIDLSDCTVIIPVHYDHVNRKENLDLVIQHLQENFDCHIFVGEQGSDEFNYVGCRYMKFGYEKFHRTKMLNVLTELSHTPIVINYDADVLIPPLQLFESVQAIRNGADFVYPYDGRFARVQRGWYDTLNSFNDVGIFGAEQFPGTREGDMKSVGGCVAYNKESFFKAGGENENFISYSPEDRERYHRYNKLGFHVQRINGIIYHIDHPLTVNSSPKNPDFDAGNKEFARIQKMSADELKHEVESWANNKQLDLSNN